MANYDLSPSLSPNEVIRSRLLKGKGESLKTKVYF